MNDTGLGGDPFAFAGPELMRSPQPVYQTLRETSPVLRVDGIGVLVTTWELADHVLHEPQLFSSAMTAGVLGNDRPLIPLQVDPPAHSKYRKILDPLFSPKRMKLLANSAESLVNTLIDGFIGRYEIDFAAEFSVPFPTQMFLTLLGLPLHELPRCLAMKDGIIRPQDLVDKPLGDPATRAHQEATAQAIYDYFTDVIADRRRQRRDDMLSWFLEAEIDGARLSDEEILDICFLFIIAGLDTVTASLDCFFSYLSRHPQLRRQITADANAVAFVVEELLRWETPVMAVARAASRDTELAGCPIYKGDDVLVLLGSANTDDSKLPDAGEVRFDRTNKRHLAFGGGVHRCLGSHLARIELQTALRVWHARIPDYCIKPGVDLEFTPGVRAVPSFPMVLERQRT
jgi:cytochrome P450